MFADSAITEFFRHYFYTRVGIGSIQCQQSFSSPHESTFINESLKMCFWSCPIPFVSRPPSHEQDVYVFIPCKRLLNFIFTLPHDFTIWNFVYFTNSFPSFSLCRDAQKKAFSRFVLLPKWKKIELKVYFVDVCLGVWMISFLLISLFKWD